ncbi:discoidin domain-containing protein [Streptomyces sp. ITFR-6]|uniref:discoidin domain-containing protein n=1 Tax=Streptomyces sp. ITFR-6 TaxID=3075197 RepID=UPI00288AA3CF|nr:discoidin domain-containing protein [Streptomyces sp. ITFR-6]WNI31870.1 discoidin domain-containing protein [Streptomyces sp. ITFR-6]
MRTDPGIKPQRAVARTAARWTGMALAVSMAVALAPAAAVAADTAPAATADDTLTVDNSTGLASDGSPMTGPGLDNTDVDGKYYSIGASQLDSSAGGTSLGLYGGKDWRNKEFIGEVVGPKTPYTMPDGTVTHPLANAKVERVDFERSPSGKYVIWMHWELKATYNASQTMALVSDKPEGPYKIVTTHARPGASLNVGAKGEAGSTDSKDAMGDRVGQLRKDFDTPGKSGEYDGSAEAPATGSDYPPQIATFPKPSGPRSDGYDPDKPDGRNDEGSYGTSVQEGNWWIYNFNDLHDDMTLKASAVRMTPYDQSAYDDAKAAGISPNASSYIVRYPAAKSDHTKAAGVSAKGYGESADKAYDPNPDDDTTPVLDEIDHSAVASEKYTAVEDDSDARKELATPEIAPRVDENTGVNKDSKSVVANQGDRAYVTADIDPAKYKVLVTTDGTDPRTSETAWQWDSRYNVPDVPITDGLVFKTVAADFDNTKFSDVATTSFTLAKGGSEQAADVPVFEPVMNFKSGDWQDNDSGMFGYAELRVLSPTFNAEVYYTMDGANPVPARYGQNLGFGSRDYSMYTDEKEFGGTGKSYLITGQDHLYMRVWELNEDMTSVVPAQEYDINVTAQREAPQVVRSPGGKYVYLFTSGQSGWYKNQAMYNRTKNLADGLDAARDKYGYRNGEDKWTPLQPFADNTTYNSQVGGVWNLGTKDKPVYLFNGSRWIAGDLESSTTVWLPMTIDDNAPGLGAATGKQVLIGKDKEGTEIKAPAYAPAPGLVSVKYAEKLSISLNNRTVTIGDGTDEAVHISTAEGDLGKVDPANHTPRVIDYQKPDEYYQCDKYDPNGVSGSTDWVTCPGGELEQQGIVHRYDIGQAFNGLDSDMDNYDGTEQAYKGRNNQFYVTVDLGQQRDLTNVAMSFKSVGGSDNAHRYTILGSNDNKTWTTIVNNNQNNFPGFQAHDVTGKQYRYVKLQNKDSYDVVHNRSADWARGLYEMTIRAKKVIPLDVSKLKPAVEQATTLSAMTDTFTKESLTALNKKLKPAKDLLDALQQEGQGTKHTQAEADKAATALATAIKNLQGIGAEVKVDVTKLAQAIENGETKLDRPHQYTKKSIQNLKSAVKKGKKVLAASDDSDTTQAEVDAATKSIKKAIAGLQPVKASAPHVDASTLKDAVEQASKIEEKNYTPKVWEEFDTALDTAKRVADAPKTQQQVVGALNQLNLSAGELVGTRH